MEVILAKTAGFCFGVKRAVDTVYKEAGKKNVSWHDCFVSPLLYRIVFHSILQIDSL